jgi:hypothetical protein
LYYRAGADFWAGKIANRAELEAIQARRYAEYFAVYKKYSQHIDRVTFWGLGDALSWRRNHNPLFLNQDWSEKLSAPAISDPEGYLGLAGEIVDASLLEGALDTFDALDKAPYTASSVAAATAVRDAGAAAATGTQRQINEAVNDVSGAAGLFEPRGSTATLAALIAAQEMDGLVEADFTAGWAGFAAALSDAHGLIDNNTDATVADVAIATVALEVAYWALDPSPLGASEVVLRGALADLIANTTSLDGSAYTDTSWDAYTAALGDAVHVLGNPVATEIQLRNAIDALVEALTGLALAPPEPDTSAVDAAHASLFAVAQVAAGLTPSDYSPTSYGVVAAALASAQTLLANTGSSAAQLQAAQAALATAVAGLIPAAPIPADDGRAAALAGLNAAIAAVAALDESDFTVASWAAVTTARASANAIAQDTSATPAQLAGAHTALVAAIAALRDAEAPPPPADTSARDAAVAALSAVVALCETLDADDYTTSSWAVFAVALARARTVAGDPASSAQQAQAADAALGTALAALRDAPTVPPAPLGPDPAERAAAASALSNIVGAAATLKAQDYTAASWAALSAALTTARDLRSDATATAAQLEAARVALNSAIAGLAARPVPTQPSSPPTTPPTTPPTAPAASPTPTPSAPVAPETGNTTVPEAPVRVGTPAAARVKTAQASITLLRGQSAKVAAYAYGADGAHLSGALTWKSSKASVATVSKTGIIKAKKAGKARIAVTASNGKSSAITVTVVTKRPAKAAKVTKVTVKAPTTTLAVGAADYLTVAYSSARALKPSVTFASSNPTVVEVDKAGRVLAKAPGKAVIAVKVGTTTKRVTLTVS